MTLDISLEFIGLFILLAGYIIGLGAVTVIDVHGFLARTSGYWTKATIRAHKVTKPLIWLGITLGIIGGVIFYSTQPVSWMVYTHAIAAVVLILNGLFLSFVVSPYLIKQEKKGKDTELLPQPLQHKIIASFIISIIGWWGSLGAFVYYLAHSFLI
ncbi:MAG: hypothetical protein WD335_03330 [Candidatus Paceibacterota bacterium]